MFFSNLNSEIKLVKVADHTTAATTDVTSASVDMTQDGGWDGVLFLTSFGTAAADNGIKAQQSSDDGSTDNFADLEGTKVFGGTAEDIWLDIFRPQEDYVRVIGLRGTSSTLESIWALLYRGRGQPADNTRSGEITGETHASPDEGTA